MIACSFCLRVCCSVHLYCPCDRAVARRLYVTTEDAKKAAVGASKAARKARMAADRAVTAARSIELAASRVRVSPVGSGPTAASSSIKSRSLVSVLRTSVSGPTPINNNNLIASVFGSTVAPRSLVHVPNIGPIAPGPTVATINNNNGPIGPISGPVGALRPRVHVPAPGSGTALCHIVVQTPAAPGSRGAASSICNTVVPEVVISIPEVEVVEESSCPSPGPRFEGPIDPDLQIWPLCLAPDWPISDSWRDFAFSTVTLKPSSDTPVSRAQTPKVDKIRSTDLIYGFSFFPVSVTSFLSRCNFQ